MGEVEAKEMLGDRLFDLWGIVNGGWEDYQEEYSPKVRMVHCANTRASIVHDHQIARATTFAHKHSGTGTRMVDLSKLHILLIDDQIAIRFKKLDYQKKSSNQPTKQVKDFLGQRSIEDMSSIVNLEAGYELSLSGELAGVSLICPKGINNMPYWEIELSEGSAQTVVKDMFDAPSDYIDEEEGADLVPKTPNTAPDSDNVIELKKKEKDGN